MRYRFALLSIVITLCICACAYAEEKKPPVDIPVYPGGETSLEINLANDEFLPMIQAMLPMLSGKLGEIAEKVKPEEIAEVLKNLKRIEVIQVDVAEKDCTDTDIANFYARNVPAGKWNRLLWQSSDKLGAVALYSLEGFDGFYGFRVSQKMEDGKPVYQATVARTEGTIDFVKLLALAGKVMMTR